MAQAAAEPTLTESHVFEFDQLPVKKSANGTEGRAIVTGILATGEAVSLHESTQPGGAAPVPLHVIHHTELIVVHEGTIAFDREGSSEQIGPGGVVLVVPGTNHRIRNAGEGPAMYCVVAIGGDVKK